MRESQPRAQLADSCAQQASLWASVGEVTYASAGVQDPTAGAWRGLASTSAGAAVSIHSIRSTLKLSVLSHLAHAMMQAGGGPYCACGNSVVGLAAGALDAGSLS